MISALFMIIWALSVIVPTLLFGLPLYYIPLWVILGYFVGLLLTVLFVMAHLPFMKLISTTHPYKAYINTSAATFLNRFVLRL